MRNYLFAAAAAALMTLGSCESNEGTSTYTYSVPTYNLVTNTEAGEEPVVSGSIYKYNFDLMAGQVTMGSDISLSSGNTVSVSTGSIPYGGGYWQVGEGDETQYGEVITINALNTGTASDKVRISNLVCQLTPFAYFPPEVQGAPAFTPPTGVKYTLMSYNIGENYRVRTFWPDMTFRGETTTSYPGTDGVNKNFTNKAMLYRVILNLKEKKATVILYNVKFGEEVTETISNIVLNDLALAINAPGISISGTNIVPKIYEAGEAKPNQEFTFDNFDCDILGDLTSASIRYKVAGAYNGQFTGSYILKVGKDTE